MPIVVLSSQPSTLTLTGSSSGTPLTIKSSGANDTNILIQNTSTGGRAYYVGASSSSGSSFGGSSNFYIYDSTASAARLVINSSGQVGIGTTSPAFPIDISAGVGGTTNGRFGSINPIYLVNSDPCIGFNSYFSGAWKNGSNTGGNSYASYFDYTPTSGSLYYNSSSSAVTTGTTFTSVTSLIIDKSGNVGIGTGSPSALLYLNSPTAARTTSLYIKSIQAGIVLDSTLSTGGYSYNIWSTMGGDGPGAGHLGFYDNTTGAYRMLITSAGYVGIGTTSPGSLLHVYNGGIQCGNLASTSTNYEYSCNTYKYGGITVYANTGCLGYNITTNNDSGGWRWRFVDNTAEAPGADYFYVFYGSGNYYFKGTSVSDRRVKSNIESISNIDAVDKISRINPVTFNQINTDGTIDANTHGGFIAQEVLEVIPELVNHDESIENNNEIGHKAAYGLDYNGILAYTVAALQEVIKENNQLKSFIRSKFSDYPY
jgi:Chaperone of endosialidase